MAETYMTRAGYEKLIKELEMLHQRKKDLSKEIGETREQGDPRENAGYQFAREKQSETLRRIADETGGRFYDAANTASLADDLRYTGRGVTTVEEHDLWHMPIVLMLLVGLLCAEWGYRRVVGLA